MLPKRRKRQRTKPHPDRVQSRSHLAFIRGFECTISNPDCQGRIEAAHVRAGGDGGIGLKPGDDRAVPLCWRHHAEQHNVGEGAFWSRYGKDPAKLAADLWAASPAGRRYRMEHDV